MIIDSLNLMLCLIYLVGFKIINWYGLFFSMEGWNYMEGNEGQ